MVNLDSLGNLRCAEALGMSALGSGAVCSCDQYVPSCVHAVCSDPRPLALYWVPLERDRPQPLPLSCLIFRWKQQPEFCVWCLSAQGGQQHQLEPQPPAERVPEPCAHLRLPHRRLPAPDAGPRDPWGWVFPGPGCVSWRGRALAFDLLKSHWLETVPQSWQLQAVCPLFEALLGNGCISPFTEWWKETATQLSARLSARKALFIFEAWYESRVSLVAQQ